MKNRALSVAVPMVLAFFLYPILQHYIIMPDVLAFAIVAGVIMLLWP
jgi:hypothetical protein